MENKTYRGSAVNDGVTLTAPLHVGDMTVQINEAPGWPDGADHRSFVAQVDGGTDAEERILCSGLSGAGPVTVTISERGYDGTVEREHSVSATFEHDLDADVIDELVLHVVDPDRDDHEQYLTTGRHADPALHEFGAALGTPAAPSPIGTVAAVGVGSGPPHDDHVHVLGAGSINDPLHFGPTVIPETAFEDGAVSTRALADATVTIAKLAAGLGPTAIANHDVIAPNIPDGTKTPLWLQGDKDRLFAWLVSAWRPIAGKPLEAKLSYHSDGNDLANDFVARDLNQFTADSDEFSMASAGGTLTIPPANTAGQGTNNVALDGEWEFRADILVSNAGSSAGATLQLFLVAGGTTYLVWSGPNAPGHSTLIPVRKRIPGLAAGQTGKLQLAHSAPAPVKILTGSTFSARYVGAS